MELTIAHLYPDLLNIYGDRGNIICLTNRCLWRGIGVKVINLSVDDPLEAKKYDLFFGGGGQDRQQLIVAKDLQKKAAVLRQEANRGVPMLTICGTYQLFGHYFKTSDGIKIPGISIFDAYTIASNQRKIGNIVIRLNKLLNTKYSILNTKLVGFENHSGNTFINTINTKNTKSNTQGVKIIPPRRWLTLDTSFLGTIIKGFGNNGKDETEGAVYKNVFGTYLHGPLLPKNPHFADLLIKLALEIKYKEKVVLRPLDDNLEWQAHREAIKRT